MERLALQMLDDAGFSSVNVAHVEGDIIDDYYIATRRGNGGPQVPPRASPGPTHVSAGSPGSSFAQAAASNSLRFIYEPSKIVP